MLAHVRWHEHPVWPSNPAQAVHGRPGAGPSPTCAGTAARLTPTGTLGNGVMHGAELGSHGEKRHCSTQALVATPVDTQTTTTTAKYHLPDRYFAKRAHHFTASDLARNAQSTVTLSHEAELKDGNAAVKHT